MYVSPAHGDYLKLARTKSGQLFRKQILRKETLNASDGRIIDIDDEFLKLIVKNFEDGVCDIVQFPLVDADNKHTEDPDRNRGEVIALELTSEGLDAIIDVRVNPDAVGTSLLGASAMIHPDYVDSKTGTHVGPTLLHVAGTNRPHLTSLEPYQKLELSGAADTGEQISLLSEMSPSPTTEPVHMNLDELKAALKDEHSLDLDALLALQTKVKDVDLDKLIADATKLPEVEAEKTKADEVLVSLTKLLTDNGVIKLSAGEAPDPTQVPTQVATVLTNLTTEVAALKLTASEREVDDFIKEGKILPAQKDAMLKLSAQDHDLFLSLVPEKPVIKLSGEIGTTGPQEADEIAEATKAFHDEVDRYTKMAADSGVRVQA